MYKSGRIFLFFLVVVFIAACQSSSQTPATSTSIEISLTATPQLTSTPVPETSSTKGWRELLSYISPEWLNVHSTQSPIGSVLYLSDIAQLRADLNLPPLTGVDDRKAKLPLITKLPSMAFEGTHPEYFKQWGWDIADVQQIVYLWDDYTQLLRGNFAQPEIRQRFLDQGYVESRYGEFSIFTKDGPRVNQYAWKPDTMIISNQESTLRSLIKRKMEGRPGLDQMPIVAQMLRRLDGAWGALLASSGSTEVAQHYVNNVNSIDKEFEKVLEEKWPEMLTSGFVFGWDALAIGWKGAKPDVTFTIMYHYPSEAEAVKDVPLLKRTLTDNPSLLSGGRLWSDKLALQTTATDGEFLLAQAAAKNDNLFSTAITNYDFTFLPVRTIPRAKSPTPTLVSSTKAITSPYGSGWSLYTNEREGFAVALPPHWAQLNLEPDLVEAGIKLWQEQNPDLPKEYADQARRAAAAGVKFIGFDVSPAGRKASFQVDVSVTRVDLPRESSLDSITSRLMQELDKVTTIVKPAQHQRIQLKAGEAEKLQVTQKLTMPSGNELSLNEIQYYFVQGNSLYILSLVAPLDYSKAYTESFEKVADSFQFVK